MEQMWRPWRIKYILSDKEKGCIFCDLPKEKKDKENYILYRARSAFIMMNLYPYNNGHLLVAPFRHVAGFEDLDEVELADFMQLVNKSTKLLKKVMNPEGFNLGVNLGRVAGAGVKDHVHLHIVPRWQGDTNFMPVIADTHVVPQSLDELYEKLYEALKD